MGEFRNHWTTLKTDANDLLDSLSKLEQIRATFPPNFQLLFDEASEVLDLTKQFLKLISETPEWPFTANQPSYMVPWGEFTSRVTDVLNITPEMDFDSARSRINNLRTGEQFTRVVEQFRPLIAFNRATEAAALGAKVHQELFGNTDGYVTKCRNAVQELSKKETQINQLYTSMLQTAGKASALPFALDFNNQAAEHRKNSRLALLAVFSVSAVIVYGAFSFLIPYISTQDKERLAKGLTELAPIAPLLGILVLLTLFLMKVYSTERHLYVINRQKELAATTFKIFVEQATDPEIREAVLQHTVSTIFSHTPTGYSKEVVDHNSSPILQVLNSRAHNS